MAPIMCDLWRMMGRFALLLKNDGNLMKNKPKNT